jgi:slime mold repeat-containing protein
MRAQTSANGTVQRCLVSLLCAAAFASTGCGDGAPAGGPALSGSSPETFLSAACGKNTLGRACDDRNPCTFHDVCTSSGCKGTAYSCNDGNACTADKCDGIGGCKFTPTTGNSCDDGNPCTFNDVCTSSGCEGNLYSCDDGNACTADTCDGMGGCLHSAASGCDDGDPCTADACDGRGGCIHTPLSGNACDDHNDCTSNDICGSGVCTGTGYRCESGNQCMVALCDGKGGCGVPGPVFNGTGCDDGTACTSPDYCWDGVCVGQPAREICNNGIDDDCNGVIDSADPACPLCVPTRTTEDCNTPEDDDCDGLVNGDDYDDCVDCNFNPCGSGTICNGQWCVSSCHDGYLNSDESDVDCGGGCPQCADGKLCWGSYDCLSNNCVYASGAFKGTCMP